MSKYMSQVSASDLLNQLSDKGLIQTNNKELESFIVAQQQDKELPLYLRALVGVGAFIASLCFIGFVVTGVLMTGKEGFTVWGLIFVALAIGLQKLSGNDNTVKNSFFMQSSFAFMATGKALFTYGMTEIFDSQWGVTFALLIITILTYHIYRMSLDRFLSTFAVLFSISINLFFERSLVLSIELLLNTFMLLQVVAVMVLIVNVKIKNDYIPLMYGILFSICANVLLYASFTKVGYWKSEEFLSPVFITLLFTSSLLALICWIMGGVQKLNTQPVQLACAGTVLLGFISAPGILLSIILMVLGYAKHEKIMITMGALLIPVFLFFYYYNLDVSLMDKSVVLIGSGLTLLAGRFYMSLKGWDKGHIL